jgi:GT2 family glycosyltransferase
MRPSRNGGPSLLANRIAMKIAVIIATIGRKALLTKVLKQLEKQTRLPDEVIISTPDATHVEPYQSRHFNITYVYARTGLAAQQNAALDYAVRRFDVVTFLDDDLLIVDDYLERLAAAFEAHPDWAVITGNLVDDGARRGGYTFEHGLHVLEAAVARRDTETIPAEHEAANGSNMSMRTRHIGDLRFDERLVLHGWLEDIDFTYQLRRYGLIISLNTLVSVHLGVRSGRASGTRFGYAQIANPIYLLRKGTIPLRFACVQMARNVAANLVKSMRPEPHIDRWGRLRGNLLAAFHVLTGRIHPEYAAKIDPPRVTEAVTT